VRCEAGIAVSVVAESRAFRHVGALFVPFWELELMGQACCLNTVRLDSFCPERVPSASAFPGINCWKGRKSFVFKPRSLCRARHSRHQTCSVIGWQVKCVGASLFTFDLPEGREQLHASP
jgi:hypothetical protein